MDTWDAITSRRNVRRFEDRPLAVADLDRILEAGRRAPSSKNWQPWDFVVVTDRAQLEQLAGDWQGAAHVVGATAAIALVARTPADQHQRDRTHYDFGQATMAMMVAAADLGIGSGHAAVTDDERMREILGLPEDRYAAYLIDLGYPADRPLQPIRRPDRRAFEDVVHRGHWQPAAGNIGR
jgi:nitroreductase